MGRFLFGNKIGYFPIDPAQTSRNAEELPSMASLRVASMIISCQVRCCLSYSQICAIFSRSRTVSEVHFGVGLWGRRTCPFRTGGRVRGGASLLFNSSSGPRFRNAV